MMRFCELPPDPSRQGHYVLAGDAQLLRIETSGPTPGRKVFACHEHIRSEGLLPIAAAAAASREYL